MLAPVRAQQQHGVNRGRHTAAARTAPAGPGAAAGAGGMGQGGQRDPGRWARSDRNPAAPGVAPGWGAQGTASGASGAGGVQVVSALAEVWFTGGNGTVVTA